MTFTVTYRDKGGAKAEIEIEAASRADCFGQCKARGIAPSGVKEGRATRVRSRNGKGGRGVQDERRVGILRVMGVACGIGILAIGTWLWFGRDDARPVGPKAPETPRAAKPKGRDGARPSQAAKPAATNAVPAANEPQPTAVEARAATVVSTPVAANALMTNHVEWIVPPLDPDDPDNALRTRTAQELGSILSVEPGDPIPPFPYSFLVEDDQKKGGEASDNGNSAFLESLRKVQIRAKETDTEGVVKHKEAIVTAQMELLDGIKAGLSVNDSIRAAYEFRVRAHEYRTSVIAAFRSWASENPTRAEFDNTLSEMNAKLGEEGIKTISAEEVVPELEEENP